MRLNRLLASVSVVVVLATLGFANTIRNSDYGLNNGGTPIALSVTNNSSATLLTADQIESASNPQQAGDIVSLSGDFSGGVTVTFNGVTDIDTGFPGSGELICVPPGGGTPSTWGTVGGTSYCMNVTSVSGVTVDSTGTVFTISSGSYTSSAPLTLVITEEDTTDTSAPFSFASPTIDIENGVATPTPEPSSISLCLGGLIAVLGPKLRRLI